MDQESAMPPPLGMRLLKRQGRISKREKCQPKSAGPQASASRPAARRRISVELVRLETPAAVYEVFSEEVASRAQGRRFLWEFFD